MTPSNPPPPSPPSPPSLSRSSEPPLLLGVENPLMDMLVQVDDDFLQQQQLKKGQMLLVDATQQAKMLAALKDKTIQHEPGGACANTMQAFSLLGGRGAFVGCVGNDHLGKIFTQKLAQNGVQCLISTDPKIKTGSAMILITPDAERTMATFLGASQSLSPQHIPEETLSQADWLYTSSYLWDSPSTKATVKETLKLARKYGVSIAINLADPACVKRNQAELRQTLGEGVQLVLGNLEEGIALTQQTSAHEALAALQQYDLIATLTMGANGVLIKDQHEMVSVEVLPTQVIDTTGAGDAFAAGLLFGLMSNASLLQAGQLGCTIAAEVVSKIGPRLEQKLSPKLKAALSFD